MPGTNAVLILKEKYIDESNNVTEIVIWKVPAPVSPVVHFFRYRLVYIEAGVRVIGFDNERGKGDHYHLYGQEYPYRFHGIDRLTKDFFAAIERHRDNEKINY